VGVPKGGIAQVRDRFVRLTVAIAIIATGVGFLQASSSGQAPKPGDAVTANRYSITIDGYEIASFSELSGIVSEIEPSDFWETSGDQVQLSKLPGKFKPPSVTLKRGMNGSLELWSWHEAVRRGTMDAARRSCSLTMYNTEGKPVAKFWLENAWPSKIDLAGLKAGASEALMETVVLTAENIQRIAP
jgi:phage tail-like protein